MKKIFLTMIAVAAFAAASFAQCVYPEDNVKIKFRIHISGTVDGDFTINESGDKVRFAQGNLQYVASPEKWQFAAHQYDFLGNGGGNKTPSSSQTNPIDLFGWATSGWNNTAADPTSVHYQPYSTCKTNHGTTNNTLQYGPSNANVVGTIEPSTAESWSKEVAGAHPYENYDWGVYNSSDLGLGWRTLTTLEWGYVFLQRTPGNSVNGTSNARYTLATINTDGTPIHGVILFPDDATMTTVEGVTWGTINAKSDWTTTCTTDGWIALENDGCVFLPAAGYRDGTSGVNHVNLRGYYWSSTARTDQNAFNVYFEPNLVGPKYNDQRSIGAAVRLVKVME